MNHQSILKHFQSAPQHVRPTTVHAYIALQLARQSGDFAKFGPYLSEIERSGEPAIRRIALANARSSRQQKPIAGI